MEYFEFMQSYEKRTSIMTRCRILEVYERYKIDTVICDLRTKRILPRSVKQREVYVYIHENHYCILWKKNRKDILLNGAEEIRRIFKYVKNKINENKLSQRYRFPRHETTDQLQKRISV